MSSRGSRIVLLIIIIFFLIIIPIVALMNLEPVRMPGRGKTAVLVDVRGELLDYTPPFSPGLIFGKRRLTLTDVINGLDKASEDRNVSVVIMRIFPSTAGIAKCEEIEEAVKRVRSKGKPVYAFSPILSGNGYLIASACDSIFMPSSGYLLIPGFASSALFFKGTLDKLGINPNMDRIGEYKSAPEAYTEKKRTSESRRMTDWLLGDIYNRFVQGIADNRGRDCETVRTWIDRAIFSPITALENGLIDRIRQWDEIIDDAKSDGAAVVSLSRYLEGYPRSRGPASSKIAVIHAQGVITMGRSGFDLSYGMKMGSESIIRELKRVREDGSVKAVVMRVDSPGGDAIASDLISREVEITSKVKPVVVSMSDVAASGGYEISFRADRIVALPSTFTGSIGSYMGKMNVRGFYNKLGMTKDEMGYGEKSLMFSDYRDFSPEEWKALREEHRNFYRHWISEIARFRGMSVGRVDSLARGRVWTGRQARDRGLVDELGGLERAVSLACRLAGIEDSSRVQVVHYPGRMSFLQEFLSGDMVDDMILYGAYNLMLGDPAPLSFMSLADEIYWRGNSPVWKIMKKLGVFPG